MGWKVIEDTFEDKDKLGKTRAPYWGGTLKCKVGDDDGNHYYTALCDDDESMENFHDWAMGDSGCTWSEYWDEEKQEWRGFIS